MAQAISDNQAAAQRSEQTEHLPHFTGDKAAYVRRMFADVAPNYDRLNAILSFAMHKRWRRLAVRMAQPQSGDTCLDVCTGTGDFAVDLAQAVGASGEVIGSDFCEPMIQNGRIKISKAPGAPIRMMVADAENLPYPSHHFAVVTVGFGVRNVAHLDKAIAEMARVAAPGGRVVILEFNRPRPHAWYKPFVDLYLFKVLPRIGGLFSRREAYTYLPESMKHFVSRETLQSLMEQSGLTNVRIRDLNFGTVVIHIGTKPKEAQS
jgi:demethylmenaquinone methyltransferase / 2-methoxy-6-polyprenyl-1,4-benzoquinol methylase